MPNLFRDLETLVLQSANWQLYRKAWHFWGYTYPECFDIRELFVLFKATFRPKNWIKSWTCCAIIFYNFRRGLTQQQCIDKLNSIFSDEAPSVFIDGILNSTEVVVHSKTNFVKVVQNHLLFRKPLMLWANGYCKIVMWPIVRLRQP